MQFADFFFHVCSYSFKLEKLVNGFNRDCCDISPHTFACH